MSDRKKYKVLISKTESSEAWHGGTLLIIYAIEINGFVGDYCFQSIKDAKHGAFSYLNECADCLGLDEIKHSQLEFYNIES